jgi:uncharacterized protein (TIGR03435 family)
MVLRLALFVWLVATAASGQSLTFEAASVKPAAPNDRTSGTMPAVTRGRLEFRNVTLKLLVYYAYGSGLSTDVNVSGGPAWIDRNRYTIEAVAKGSPSDRDYRSMLRNLLEDRFALKTHAETRDIEPYVLVLDRADGKLGPKVKPWPGTCIGGTEPRDYTDRTLPRCPSGFRPPGLVLEGVSMIPLAEMLSIQRRLLGGRIVQDRTGVDGAYNIELEFDFGAANQPDYTGPSIFTALKEQLGVKLQLGKGLLRVIVVDSASVPNAD